MRLGSTVPNFKAETTQGPLRFYDWQGDSEILRCIDSLQLTDRLKVIATPANWTPGTKVMILPSVSDEDAHKVFPKGFDKVSMPSGVNYVRTTENY